MKNPTWPKVFAFVGLALIGLVVAVYATTVATAGVTAWIVGRPQGGGDLLTLGNAVLLAGMAVMAAFSYLALRGIRDLKRR